VFTVTPNAGFIASVGGTCTGTLVGTTYTTNAITSACTVSATFAANLALNAVQSRKTHGAAGTFDLPISTVPAVTGLVSTEPRVIGGGHQIVFQFNQAITAAGAVTLTDANGNPIGAASAAINGGNTSEVIVTITGVANTRVLVSLANITAATGMLNTAAAVGFMQGDINNNRSVNASDVVSIRNRLTQPTTAANAKFDLDLSGTVDAADVALVKGTSGSGL
jgi:Dockerin type I domain